MSGENQEKRVVRTAADLVFYTDTDESEYPIYLTAEREVWLKAKPHHVVALDEYTTAKRYDIPVIAMFYVTCERLEDGEQVTHPLFEVAIAAVREITKKEPEVVKYAITYEVFRGESELLGEARAFAIRILSRETPYSGVKHARDRAWAVGYAWKKRLAAKYPQLAPFTYLVGERGKHLRAYVRLVVKLPVTTPDFVKLFDAALSQAPAASTPAPAVPAEVQELERLIAEKERELAELKARLEALKRLRSVSGRVASMIGGVGGA
jgi:hypothetical protein